MQVKTRRVKGILYVTIFITVIFLIVVIPVVLKLLSHAGLVKPEGLVIGNMSPSSVTIAWITAESTDGAVTWGMDKDLGNTTNDLRMELLNNWTQGYSHIVKLTDLAPATTYYYRIVTGNKVYPPTDQPPFSFNTPGVSEQQLTSPLKLFGDIGTSTTDYIIVVKSEKDRNAYPFIAPVTEDGTWYTDVSASYDQTSLTGVTFAEDDPFSVVVLGRDGGSKSGVKSVDSPVNVSPDPQTTVLSLISTVSNVTMPRDTGTVYEEPTTPAITYSPTPTYSIEETITVTPSPTESQEPTQSISPTGSITITPTGTVTEEPTQSEITPTIEETPISIPPGLRLKYLQPNDLRQDIPLLVGESGYGVGTGDIIPTFSVTPVASNAVSELEYPLLGNTSESSVTIVWRTVGLENTIFSYGEQDLNETEQDVRGEGQYYFHVITLKYLTPQATYNYKAGEYTGTFTMPATLSSPPSLLNISGIVNGEANECLIVAQLKDDSTESDYGLLVTVPEQPWSLDVAGLRVKDLSDYFDISDSTNLVLNAYCVDNVGILQTGQLNVSIGDAKDNQIVISLEE